MSFRSEYILNSNFTGVNLNPSSIYTISDWYNTGRAGKVPLAILTAGMEPFSYSGSVLKIGADASSNKTYLVSKNVFRYNPSKYYRVRLRLKMTGAGNTKFSAGFVGLTSNPVPNLIPNLHAIPSYNEILNFSRFTTSAQLYGTGSGNDLTGSTFFNCIRESNVVASVYTEYEGFINGTTTSDVSLSYNDQTFGLTAANPVPIRQEVLYFAPYVIANELSVNGDGGITYLDYITVEELHDNYDM